LNKVRPSVLEVVAEYKGRVDVAEQPEHAAIRLPEVHTVLRINEQESGVAVVAPSGKVELIATGTDHLFKRLYEPGSQMSLMSLYAVDPMKPGVRYPLTWHSSQPPRNIDASILDFVNSDALPPGVPIGTPTGIQGMTVDKTREARTPILGMGYPHNIHEASGLPALFISPGHVTSTNECSDPSQKTCTSEFDSDQYSDRGDSGGPQFNTAGQVIGIMTRSDGISKTISVPMSAILPYLDHK
jgi:hypothetical protein